MGVAQAMVDIKAETLVSRVLFCRIFKVSLHIVSGYRDLSIRCQAIKSPARMFQV